VIALVGYIREFVSTLIRYLKANTDVPQGMEITKSGWCEVSERKIDNCWKESGVVISSQIAENSLEDIDVPEELREDVCWKLYLAPTRRFEEFNVRTVN
jgi:hypothetical protein